MSEAGHQIMATVHPCEAVDGVVLVDPVVHGDARGYLVESYRREWLPEGAGEMVQVNRVERRRGTLVGLHWHRHQADYWYVVGGPARVVLHDLRTGSATEGATWTAALGAPPHVHTGLYIPAGVAHGFAAVGDVTMTYMVDRYYDPSDELGLAWDDPDVAADWGVADPILSERDRANPRRTELELPGAGPSR